MGGLPSGSTTGIAQSSDELTGEESSFKLYRYRPARLAHIALLRLTRMRLFAQCMTRHLQATALTVFGTVGIGASTALLIIASGQIYRQLGGNGFSVMAARCASTLPLAQNLREPS